MATDIFNKTPRNVVGAFSVDKATLQFPGVPGLQRSGLLVQNVQISYTQQVSFIYDLSKSDDVYYVAGRTSGTMSLGKMVGSAGIVTEFYKAFGDVCNVKGKNIELQGVGGCSSVAVGSKTITIREPVIVQMGLTMNVDTALIGENSQMIFSTMELQ
jgi:hypothetical protein